MNLEDLLREQAERAPLSPASFETVTRHARRLRRRTAMATVGAAAAVAVVVGGAAVVAHGGSSRTTAPIAHSPSASSRSSGSAPVAPPPDDEPPARPVRLDHLAAEQTTGGDLAAPLWQDGRILSPDGSSASVPGPITGLTRDPSTGDWLVLENRGGTTTDLLDVAPSGKIVWERRSTPRGLAASEVGVAYLTWEKGTWTLTATSAAGHTQALSVGDALGDDAGVGGLLPSGETVFWRHTGSVQLAHRDGTVSVLPRATEIGAVSGKGQIAALVPAPAGSECTTQWAVLDATGAAQNADGRPLCGGRVTSFSRDGATMVLEEYANTHDPGPQTLRLVGVADGRTVAAFNAAGGYFSPSVVWQDSALVADLFVADRSAGGDPQTPGTWGVVWLDTNGFRVARGSQRPGTSGAPPYVFGTGTPGP